jgi:hypothetical protein
MMEELVHGCGILALGISVVFIITSILKKHPEEVKPRSDRLLNRITSRRRK